MRWVRHLLCSTLLVVLVSAAVGLSCLAAFSAADAQLAGLSARTTGELSRVAGSTVVVRFDVGGRTVRSAVRLDGSPPRAGTRTEVAYDPADPRRAVIPRAAVLRTVDRSAAGMGFAAVFVAAVLGYDGWLLARRFGLFRQDPRRFAPRRLAPRRLAPRRLAPRRLAPRRLALRRVRLQRGLLTRSWLETEGQPERWIPVHFDPALVTLPSPAELLVYGDPRPGRLVAAETADGVRLYPSGPVRGREPGGRRSDNPARPDDDARRRAADSASLRRQYAADAPRLAVAPLVGVFWAFLDGSGVPGWLAATGMVAALSLWLAAVRGSDPS